MKKGKNDLFNQAVLVENSKTWHLCFAKKRPKIGKSFKCTSLFIESDTLANTKITKVANVQEIEKGLCIIHSPGCSFITFILGEYTGIHTHVGFMDSIPQDGTSPNISVIFFNENELNEKNIVLDPISFTKKLDDTCFYLSTIAGKAYYVFLRQN